MILLLATTTTTVRPTSAGVPLWVPILVAVLGLLGVGYTQYRSDRREREARRDAREREQEARDDAREREREQWDRLQEQQREQWEREDRQRTYERRREVYEAFAVMARRTWSAAWDSHNIGGRPVDDDDLEALYAALEVLELFATREALAIANKATDVLARYCSDPAAPEAIAELKEMREVFRKDLHVPASVLPPAEPHSPTQPRA